MLRSELAATVRKAMNAVVSGEAAEERAKAAEQARAQVWGGESRPGHRCGGGEGGGGGRVRAVGRGACLAAEQTHALISMEHGGKLERNVSPISPPSDAAACMGCASSTHCPHCRPSSPPPLPRVQAEAARNEADRLRREAQVRGVGGS